MGKVYREMRKDDYEAAYRLWQNTEGMALSEADSEANIAVYLARNPGFSFVCEVDGRLAGTILCGHDGRRGLIHHLVTAESHRRRGVASALLERSLGALCDAGITKCHLLVFRSNEAGLAFWREIGAQERSSIALFSMATNNDG